MLCILKFVCLCVKLLGFNVDSFCLWVNFVNGFVWFINWDNWEFLKNFLIDVIIGWILISVCGVIVFVFWIDIFLWIICFIWERLIWNWFCNSFLIECRWRFFKWLILFVFFILYSRLKK